MNPNNPSELEAHYSWLAEYDNEGIKNGWIRLSEHERKELKRELRSLDHSRKEARDNGVLPFNGHIPHDPTKHDSWDYRYLSHAADYMDTDSETDTRLPQDDFEAQIITTRHRDLIRFFEEIQEHNEDAEWLDYLESDLSVDDDITDEEYYESFEGDEGSFFEDIVDGEYPEVEAAQEELEKSEVTKLVRRSQEEKWEDETAKETRPGNRQRPSITRDKERKEGRISESLARDYEAFWDEAYEEREQIAELITLEMDQDYEEVQSIEEQIKRIKNEMDDFMAMRTYFPEEFTNMHREREGELQEELDNLTAQLDQSTPKAFKEAA